MRWRSELCKLQQSVIRLLWVVLCIPHSYVDKSILYTLADTAANHITCGHWHLPVLHKFYNENRRLNLLGKYFCIKPNGVLLSVLVLCAAENIRYVVYISVFFSHNFPFFFHTSPKSRFYRFSYNIGREDSIALWNWQNKGTTYNIMSRTLTVLIIQFILARIKTANFQNILLKGFVFYFHQRHQLYVSDAGFTM